MISYHKNEWGDEFRFRITRNRIYIVNLTGCIGADTSNEDLWWRGWTIGFSKISRFIRPLGIYIFLATYDRQT